jgi:hypothetical protein
MSTSRPIVITPYYKEDPVMLRRCMASVHHQTVPTEHMLVADGHPQDWLESEPVRHLRLDRPHGDFGNTPRGVGSLLAAAEGFAPIIMLDADNWLEPGHVEACIRAAASAPGTDFVVATSQFRRPDESIMPIPNLPTSDHVDTSCFAFFPGSYQMLAVWALMPRQMSAVGDRIFWRALRARGLSGVAITNPATVNYHCLWESLYRGLGETPPPGAKPNFDDPTPMYQWWYGLTAREREIMTRLVGLSLDDLSQTR